MAAAGCGSQYARDDEARSMEQLAVADRDGAAADAKAWAERLLADRISLRDQSSTTVRIHVQRLIDLCYRLHDEKEQIKQAFEKYKQDDTDRARRQYNAMRKADRRKESDAPA